MATKLCHPMALSPHRMTSEETKEVSKNAAAKMFVYLVSSKT